MALPKSEIKHRMTRRLNGWDYCQRAIYMITVTLADRRREWLGRLILANNGEAQRHATDGASRNNGDGASHQACEAQHLATDGASRSNDLVAAHSCAAKAKIRPTAFGIAALEALAEMPRLYPQVEIIESQLMPEHMHFVIFVREPLNKPLSALIRGFKAGATRRWRSAVAAHSCAAIPAWAEGFNDAILFRDGQLRAMIDYVRDNPRRLAEKRANPALFSRVAQLELPLDGGRITGRFEALGNRHLLSRPLVQVQCSRRHFAYRRIAKPGGGFKIAKDASGEPIIERISHEYEERLESALAAAEHGAVMLSPCISDGEKQIAREALKRKIPLVALRNMGFSKCEKPTGRHFEACAQGRLLLLAPAAWPYSTEAKAMTRFDATALNRIAQWLAGEDAAEINYHGMKPCNIDKLAEEAVAAQH